jgi:hypothetical protein
MISMKLQTGMKLRRLSSERFLRHTALALAISLAGSGLAVAQSTTGTIFGSAPAAAGETVHIQNTSSGLSRDIPVDSRGRFNASALPIGTYTVSLQRDGKTVDSHSNVELRVGTSTQVSFAAASAGATSNAVNAQNLSGVTVSANALPTIDVTAVDSRTVLTAQELARIPLPKSAEAAALLAPGAVAGSKYFGGVSFSGSSIAENAYYINGFNTSNSLTNEGGVTLPYDAIEQQETLTAGYGPQYGRSDGGVISQVGKRGSNEWHFGGRVEWVPRSAKADPPNNYYPQEPKLGELYAYNKESASWDEVGNAYISGPLIKDRLFIYFNYQAERSQGSSIGSVNSPYKTQYHYIEPKWYGKVDWNINDKNILEFTGISTKSSYQAEKYHYDYDTMQEGAFYAESAPTKTTNDIGIIKYTGYLTDNLTLSVLYGKSKEHDYIQYPGYDPSKTYISAIADQNPAIVGDNPVQNPQPFSSIAQPTKGTRSNNLRVDLSEHLGDHTISFGIDNLTSRATDQGTQLTGPGYWWIYENQSNDPNALIDPKNGVPSPVAYPGGSTGYYVEKYHYLTLASARTVQHAQYVEDAWQVNDKLLLKLGLRNDQFTNYNSGGQPYIRQTKPQLAPRLGFAWDVNGDSSFKVFGNVGRYYLALPNQLAIRAAGGQIFTYQYFTYTGVNPDGTPSGLTALPPGVPVASSPAELTGTPPDPATITAKGINPEFQDEYVLGFQKQLTPNWVYGVKGVVRNLRNEIEDECDRAVLVAAAQAQGLGSDVTDNINSCYIVNPGRAADFSLLTPDGGHVKVNVPNAAFGFPQVKRKYAGLEFTLQHPFDGTWFGSFSYTFSHSYGNTEGPVRSDTEQNDESATTSFDHPSLMVYANGDQSNDVRHYFKLYGYWQVAPEWLVGANVVIHSGTPNNCLGAYGGPGTPDDQRNPSGNSYDYHFCNDKPEPPGANGTLRWQEIVSTNVEYRPKWADKKLAFNFYVVNLFNQQRPLGLEPSYNSTNSQPGQYYQYVNHRQDPRYVRVEASYDF